MNMPSIHLRRLWIAVLAVAGSAAGAAEQPPSSETPSVATAPTKTPSASAGNLRRLPPADLPLGSSTAPGESETSPTEDGCFWVVSSPVSWETYCDTEPGDAQFETLPPVAPGEPLLAGQLTDESGKLIQIAPGPVDPWCDDPFGRYAYHGSGDAGRSYWIPGSGDRMGIFALTFADSSPPEEGKNSFDLISTWHMVSGPKRSDMPPHLFDFTARLGRRDRLDLFWSYDVALRPGWFSDFEGSAREGLRFPGHGVLYYTPSDSFQLQVGVDYLDRDDIAWLPVFGAVFKPHPDFRLDAVFPRPRIAYRCGGQKWIYLAAEMGGGTWAIERADWTNDVATYRDYRISIGLQNEGEATNYMEFGYVFGRHLEYRSGTPSYDPLDTTILRSVVCY
jgi:hypothetical protein